MEYKIKETKDTLNIAVSGMFTFRDQEQFLEILPQIEDTKAKELVFDLSECVFLDSAGLGLLVVAHDTASLKNMKQTITGAKDTIKDVLFAARFDNLYTFEK